MDTIRLSPPIEVRTAVGRQRLVAVLFDQALCVNFNGALHLLPFDQIRGEEGCPLEVKSIQAPKRYIQPQFCPGHAIPTGKDHCEVCGLTRAAIEQEARDRVFSEPVAVQSRIRELDQHYESSPQGDRQFRNEIMEVIKASRE